MFSWFFIDCVSTASHCRNVGFLCCGWEAQHMILTPMMLFPQMAPKETDRENSRAAGCQRESAAAPTGSSALQTTAERPVQCARGQGFPLHRPLQLKPPGKDFVWSCFHQNCVCRFPWAPVLIILQIVGVGFAFWWCWIYVVFAQTHNKCLSQCWMCGVIL